MWKDAEEFLLKDKYIAPLVNKWGSCTIKKSPKSKYFIDLLEAITNQQLSGKAASTIFGRVKDLCKGGITPEAILKLSEAKLRNAGLSFAKIKYVKDLADKVKRQEVKVESMENLSDEEVIMELVKVKGIGRWTAEMFLMFSLGRPDVFPVDDLGIKKGFEKVTGKTFDREKSAKFAEKHWKPWRTVASWYLWRSLENR
jgi:DNA-3-methyladenine glycosylase II